VTGRDTRFRAETKRIPQSQRDDPSACCIPLRGVVRLEPAVVLEPSGSRGRASRVVPRPADRRLAQCKENRFPRARPKDPPGDALSSRASPKRQANRIRTLLNIIWLVLSGLEVAGSNPAVALRAPLVPARGAEKQTPQLSVVRAVAGAGWSWFRTPLKSGRTVTTRAAGSAGLRGRPVAFVVPVEGELARSGAGGPTLQRTWKLAARS
jgi:hypothetical protein